MTDLTATPETGTVDAPVSMDSIIAEFETGNTPDDAADEAVRELVKDTEEGDADEAADEGDATDASEDGVDEAPAAEADEAPEPTYKVTVNGEEADVPLSELLKGYSREADYTKKTQALAEERKSLETDLSAKYANELKQATDLFVQLDPILAETQNIDWQALAQEDPNTYTQLRAAVDARLQAVGKAREGIEAATQQRAEAEHAETQAGIKATEEAIRKSSPELAEDDKLRGYFSDTLGELFQIGLDQQDVQGIMSNPAVGPQILSLVADARKYRAMEKAKATLPARKVVPVSGVKALRSDASDGSNPPRKLRANASTDERADFVVKQLLEGA